MGLLDRLTGKKPTLTIAVDPPVAAPGDEVRVHVVLEGEIDDKAQAARAGVRCVNEYLVREYDRREHEWEEKWRAVTLHEDFQDLPLAAGDHDFTFTIPQGLPPASDKAVSWWAWAQVERHRGIDANASERIAVRLPAEAAPGGRVAYGTGDGGISFSDMPASVAAGATIDGAFTVCPPDEIKATGIRVRLTRTRTYTADGNEIVKRDHYGPFEVSGGVELPAGQTQEFGFSIPVPPNAAPSAQAPHAVADWRVTAIIARRMRDDYEVSAPVVVHSG